MAPKMTMKMKKYMIDLKDERHIVEIYLEYGRMAG